MITECKLSLEEIKALSKKMVLLVDSREKKNKHIMEYFMKHMLSYEIRQLPYGDYSFYLPAGTVSGVSCPLYFHREIVLERKASLEELSGNLGKERERFEKELGKAARDRCKVYLLVESPGGYGDIIGHKYQTEFKPASYLASLKSYESRYGLNIQFTEPEYSGYLIYSTLYYFMRERLI